MYELVVRNPSKGASSLPVATYLTCDHTTACVTYFLQAFQTDMMNLYGKKAVKRPIMIICDGSLVLLNSISSHPMLKPHNEKCKGSVQKTIGLFGKG